MCVCCVVFNRYKSCFDRTPIHFCVFSLSCSLYLTCVHLPVYLRIRGNIFVYYLCISCISLYIPLYIISIYLPHTLQLVPLSRASVPVTMKKYKISLRQRSSFTLEMTTSRDNPQTTFPLSYDEPSFAKPQAAVRLGVQR